MRGHCSILAPTPVSPDPRLFHTTTTMASGLARALGDATLADQGGADYTPGAILVTGGAGFIASHVVIRLVEAGHKVRENKLSYETARSVSPVCALLPLRTSHPSSH